MWSRTAVSMILLMIVSSSMGENVTIPPRFVRDTVFPPLRVLSGLA
jgi:hypothetical protein